MFLTAEDQRWLNQALVVSLQGAGNVRPNPLVGAVVVADGQVLAEGAHLRYGDLHAEANALVGLGDCPVDTTIYVTLEPCDHHGKQPPCSEAIIKSGIRRVVIASEDPSPHADGAGIEKLRAAGVEVVVADADSEIAQRCVELNQEFRKRAQTKLPYVIMKTATTLDGKIATASGSSQWITSEAARAYGHSLRAQSDAVAVGIGTVLADDPELTVRSGEVANQPRRIVFDRSARLPLTSKLIKTINQSAVIVVVDTERAPLNNLAALKAAGVEIISIQTSNPTDFVLEALTQLYQLGIYQLMLEGGAELAGSFLVAGQIDQLYSLIAPKLVGDQSAPSPFAGLQTNQISEAVIGEFTEFEKIGVDLLVKTRMKRW